MSDIKVAEQLVLHDPDNGVYGDDCYRAMLATLLGVDTEQVPHFLHDNCDAKTFNTRVNEYLAQFGLVYMSFNVWDIPQWKKDAGISIPIYHEIADDSPRFSGTGHAVVGKDGEVFHDPHPTKLGLPKVTDKRTIGFLVQAIPDSRNKTICDLRAQLAEKEKQLAEAEEHAIELARLFNEEVCGASHMGEPVIIPNSSYEQGRLAGRKEMQKEYSEMEAVGYERKGIYVNSRGGISVSDEPLALIIRPPKPTEGETK